MLKGCICKHDYVSHVFKPGWGRYQCEECMKNNFVNGIFISDSFPAFHAYAEDNLIYLENVIRKL